MAHILVIDLGTTYFKFALFDQSGRLGKVVRLAPPTASPQPGWLEVDARAFAECIAEGIARLRDASPDGLGDLKAVTFATQTNSIVLLDSQDRPLGPILLWPDRRAQSLEEEIRRRAAIAGFTATTGIPGVSHQFMIARLLWLQKHSPDVWRRIGKLCLVSDYLSLLLTGRHATEAGAAGLVALVDVPRAQWWPAMVERVGLDARWLAEIVRAGTELGTVTAAASERFGLPSGCRFVVGCLDQYAGAIGVGNVAPGAVSETTGTVLATVRCSERWEEDAGPAVFQGPAYRENLYYQMAFGDVSANWLEWYRGTLPDRPEAGELVALVDGVPPGADGLRLDTSRPPGVLDKVFVGLVSPPQRGQAVRAILETVAVALRDHVMRLCGGKLPAGIRSAGGAARSERWLEIKANVLGIPVTATRCAEPTSLGAAILAEAAMSGAGVAEVAEAWVRLGDTYQPDARVHQDYREMYPAGG